MKALLLNSARGIIAFNESIEAVDIVYNDIPINELADKYILLENGKIPDEFEEFIRKLANLGYFEFQNEHPLIINAMKSIKDIQTSTTESPNDTKVIRRYLIQHLESLHVYIDEKSYNAATKTLAEYIAAKGVAKRSTEHDLHIKEAVESINELDRTINSFTARLREWYGLHFPELTDKLIEDNHKFAQFVSKIGTRDNITISFLQEQLEFDIEKAQYFIEKAERSMGGEVTERDIKMIQDLSEKILDLIHYRKETEDYISETLEEVAPNLKFVLGSQIAAKLIAEAGSIERLSMMSSSTIQLLGAEKALFKALRSGGKTPKYGLLFQWHKIRGQKPHIRGKIARMASGKISILAKIDYFKGDFMGDKIAHEIEKKINYIKNHTPKTKKELSQRPKHSDKGKKKQITKKGKNKPRRPRNR